MQIRNRRGNVIPLLALAAAGSMPGTSSGIEMGHLRRFVRPGAHGGNYLDLDAAQAAGIDMGLQLAGAGAKRESWQDPFDSLKNEVYQLHLAINGVSDQVKQLATAVSNPSASTQVAARRADARARNTPVLLDVEPDQRRLQHLPVSAILPSVAAAAGSTNVFGASQIILKPKRMIVGGATVMNTALAPFGLAGAVITQVFVGNKLQTTAVPGGGGGLPIEYFAATAFDANFEYDTIGPAITVSLGVAWPAWWLGTAIPFNANITGDSAFS
jgi:hypothetical protein